MSLPFSYTPYQSHRRTASSLSTSTAVSPPATISPQDQANGGGDASLIRQKGVGTSSSNLQALGSVRALSGSQLTNHSQPITNVSNALPSEQDKPPPLRKITAVRSTAYKQPLSSVTKGKQNADQTPQLNPPLSLRSPERKSVSNASSNPTSQKLSLPSNHKAPETQSKTSVHVQQLSPSPSPSSPSRSHARTVSHSTIPTSVPHLMSTAQRLRTANSNASTPSSSPSQTPGTISPALNASHGTPLPLNLTTLSLHGSDSVGRNTAYREGFQPKGMYRIRTDEFLVARSHHKRGKRGGEQNGGDSELEAQRIERRLQKLIALHYETRPHLTEEEDIRVAPSWLPTAIRKARIQAEEEKRIREEEMRIVKWEDDSSRRTCFICSTPFSLTVRKHHCRLCGRLVCASPHLSLPPGLTAPSASALDDQVIGQRRCSGLIVADGKSRTKIRDVSSHEERNLQMLKVDPGLRVCHECRDTIRHRQYMLDDGTVPTYVKLYETLVSLQKEIEQSLPEFQEMVLGLQKQDAAAALGTSDSQVTDPLAPHANLEKSNDLAALKAKSRSALALQRDAAHARKQLLANFANYDLIAKKIRNLEDDGNPSLARVKMAIWTQANVFLQNNMFPLQNLPKLSSKDTKSNRGSKIKAPPNALPSKTNDLDTGASNDTQEALKVLEQQLNLVRQYAASASKARKFQDVTTLQASARDLENEIKRLRDLGVSSD